MGSLEAQDGVSLLFETQQWSGRFGHLPFCFPLSHLAPNGLSLLKKKKKSNLPPSPGVVTNTSRCPSPNFPVSFEQLLKPTRVLLSDIPARYHQIKMPVPGRAPERVLEAPAVVEVAQGF